MRAQARTSCVGFALVASCVLAARPAVAGGGPTNVVVLFSADDPKSTAIAEHYATARALPDGHLCGLAGFTPETNTIDGATFLAKVQAPLDACLAALPHPEEVDYLVLARGLPYSVTLENYPASFEAVLQVGHAKHATKGELAGAPQPVTKQPAFLNPAYVKSALVASDFTLTNPYATWYTGTSAVIRATTQPPSFRRATAGKAAGYDFAGQLFVVSALDGFDDADAHALVDRAVASDGTRPTADLLCMRAEDEARGARDPECELATRMLKGAGLPGTFLDPFDGKLAGRTLAAYFTGSADGLRGAIAGNAFVPGAITDNLTSFGAAIPNFSCAVDGSTCPAAEVQTSVARFVRAGATGAHGTVNEPYNNVFPNASALLFYTFGYGLGESYLFAQRYLYWQNVHLGDPLATPYAERPAVTIEGGDAHPRGTPVVVAASHPDGVAKLELFLGGKRVASVESDTLSYALDAEEGAKAKLLAVATAKNAPVTRAGWPVASQAPQPDVKGWQARVLTVTAPEATGAGGSGGAGGADAGATVSGGGDPTSGGSDDGGCAMHGAVPAEVTIASRWLAALALVAGARRRRRRDP